MRLLWAVGAAFLGAILGYILSAITGMLIFDINRPGDSGGTAMGIMFGLAPIGAIVGAIVGMILAIRGTRRKPNEGSQEETPVSPDLEPDDNTDLRQALEGKLPVDGRVTESARVKKTKGAFDWQPMAAVIIVLAIIIGIYQYLFYDPYPDNYGSGPNKPILFFEVSIPAKAVREDDFFKVRTELRSWEHVFSPRGKVARREEGENVVLTGSISMYNKVDDRRFWLYPSPKVFVEFELDIAAVPENQREFTTWSEPDLIEIHSGGEIAYPLKKSEVKLRYRTVVR